MKNQLDWRKYVNSAGNFELPAFLYKMILSLMKESLDLGTLLSNDDAKTRAYKERVKKTFTAQWQNLAEVLEYFDIIVPCECHGTRDFCELCGGSRYLLDKAIEPTVLREYAIITANGASDDIQVRLQQGLEKAIQTVSEMNIFE